MGKIYIIFRFKYNALLLEYGDHFFNACNLYSEVVEATIALAVKLTVGFLNYLKNDVNAKQEHNSECAVCFFMRNILDLLESENICVKIYCLFDVCRVEGDVSQALYCRSVMLMTAITITHIKNSFGVYNIHSENDPILTFLMLTTIIITKILFFYNSFLLNVKIKSDR